MKTNNLGYPRIGSNRELKKACEQYWAGKITTEELQETGRKIRRQNWIVQKEAGIDMIPSNDFSFYDQVLDMSFTVGAIPDRFQDIRLRESTNDLDLYFAMARGYQKGDLDITAMEMTKWFDTNYHYIVPEFSRNQDFILNSSKIVREYKEALKIGIKTKPVLIGPVTFLLLGKEKEEGFDRLDLIEQLLPVYMDLLMELSTLQVEWVQFDEPFLALDLEDKSREIYQKVYSQINQAFPEIKIMVATYFEGLRDNTRLALSLPVSGLHLDLVRCPDQLTEVLDIWPPNLSLSMGIVDGRNIWINEFHTSLELLNKAIEKIGTERIFVAPSCSLLHVPYDLDFETRMDPEIKQWLAFAKQKLEEMVALKKFVNPDENKEALEKLKTNLLALESRKVSKLIHNEVVKKRVENIRETDGQRKHKFSIRKSKQRETLQLPSFPTTTIGSFPQTAEVRKWRARYKKGLVTQAQYDQFLRDETEKTIRIQEEIGLDVLVHGEFERNDMVEYFGEKLAGFIFTQNGWVQSYGSRCVKPPIIFGDIWRENPMTVQWSVFAQSLTDKPVKGMLTGPVTILQWSFVRNDQPRSQTCAQIALAIRDEVIDLEQAGIRIIQIDEPAIREGLPLRRSAWDEYLQWAVQAFRIASGGVQDETQIHTHMCYSEFNDILQSISNMDADVITIECSRSQMELLDAFADFRYPNDIGPGVYDIHSPRLPSESEMVELLEKAQGVIDPEQLWVNPDCGLKTRGWEETKKALEEMVKAAHKIRQPILEQ